MKLNPSVLLAPESTHSRVAAQTISAWVGLTAAQRRTSEGRRATLTPELKARVVAKAEHLVEAGVFDSDTISGATTAEALRQLVLGGGDWQLVDAALDRLGYQTEGVWGFIYTHPRLGAVACTGLVNTFRDFTFLDETPGRTMLPSWKHGALTTRVAGNLLSLHRRVMRAGTRWLVADTVEDLAEIMLPPAAAEQLRLGWARRAHITPRSRARDEEQNWYPVVSSPLVVGAGHRFLAEVSGQFGAQVWTCAAAFPARSTPWVPGALPQGFPAVRE